MSKLCKQQINSMNIVLRYLHYYLFSKGERRAFPVVLSHGLGGSRDGYDYLGRLVSPGDASSARLFASENAEAVAVVRGEREITEPSRRGGGFR